MIIHLFTKDVNFPFKISMADVSSNENKNVDFNISLEPPPEEPVQNEYSPSFKKSSTFKEVKKCAQNLIHLNLPNRSSSDASTKKRDISNDKKNAIQFSKEAIIVLITLRVVFQAEPAYV
ncbi:hypothetical protein MXB_4308 [Myxobolus squamalis]|nr:hypothetical protein MXB_4308 [Myxobolus squamalis]